MNRHGAPRGIVRHRATSMAEVRNLRDQYRAEGFRKGYEAAKQDVAQMIRKTRTLKPIREWIGA